MEEMYAEEGKVMASGEPVEVKRIEVPLRRDAGQKLLRLLNLRQKRLLKLGLLLLWLLLLKWQVVDLRSARTESWR